MTLSSTAAAASKKPRRFKSQRKASAPSNDVYDGDIEVNDDAPTASNLVKCADFPVLDSNRQPRSFKSLYSGDTSTKRTLVLFIRHFFCGVSDLSWCPFMAFPALMIMSAKAKTMP